MYRHYKPRKQGYLPFPYIHNNSTKWISVNSIWRNK